MTKSKDNDKGSRSKIAKHEGTCLQRRQRQRQELNDKSNLNELTKECHNELTSGEIVSLKILSRTNDGSQSGDKVTAYNDVERVSELSYMPNNDLLYDNNHNNIMPDKDKVLSEDPFNLYDILHKRKDSGDYLKYPPRFTPSVTNVEEVNKIVKGAMITL
nr:hypothetical protein [Tanacetum cinerariifolium]